MQVKEKGQSLVELAISLVVILILLSGVVEFGIAFFQFIQLRDAVQEGALYGSIHPYDNVQIEERVRAASNSPLDLQSDTVLVVIRVVDENPKGCSGDAIEVHAQYAHKVFMPFFSALIGNEYLYLHAKVVDTVLSC